MSAPTVSVVIPFYGDPSQTLQLVNDLQQQNDPPRFEIIVSDDASPVPFPATDGVHVVRRERNGGFAQAVNTGAAQARGDFLLILNSDLSVGPEFLASLHRKAERWMPAIVSLPLSSPDGHVSWSGRHFPTIRHSITEWLTPLVRIRHLPLLHEAVGHDILAEGSHDESVDWVVGALMYLPRATYHAVAGMDETFYMNSEEVDLQYRLRQLGIPSVILGGLSVVHEGGGSSASDSRTAWMLDGRRRYIGKWNSPLKLLAFDMGMTLATGANAIWNVQRHLRGENIDILKEAQHQYQQFRHPEQWIAPAHRAKNGVESS